MQPNYVTQINKLVNLIMKRGKKNVAKTILFTALLKIKKQTSKNPIVILRKALSNATPIVIVVPKKRGSKVNDVPTPVSDRRSDFLAASWIRDGAKIRSGSVGRYDLASKLSEEIIESANGNGEAVHKKQSLYKVVLENRHYIRY